MERSDLRSLSQLQSRGGQISTAGSTPSQALPTVTGEQAHLRQYLIFTLIEREFAINAEQIQGVERLADVTPLPNVANWVSGVINLRGSIASVVDLRTFLDMEQLPYNPRTRLLSVQCNDMVICLVVDSVSEMLQIPDALITSSSGASSRGTRQSAIPSWIAPFASGSVLLGNRGIVLLDAMRLLFSDKMQHYEG